MEKPKILEINLISAQDLKPPSTNLRQLHTYAIVYLDSSTKLRTRIDRVGGENPTWNDKFLFKVTPGFLSSETSGVSIEIYAVGLLRDPLIGSVRFLASNIPPFSPVHEMGTPSCISLQIQRPSGRFQGVLNLGAMVVEGSDFSKWNGALGIGYRNLMGESIGRRQKKLPPCDLKKSVSMREMRNSESSCGGDSSEISSDGAESTTSSSSAASSALKDWNSVRDLAGNRFRASSDGGSLSCGFLKQRRLTMCFSAQNLSRLGEYDKEN